MTGSLLYASIGDELADRTGDRRVPGQNERALLTTGTDFETGTEVVTPSPRTEPGYVIDLFPTAAPVSPVMWFVREVSTLDHQGGASSVAEGDAKVEQEFEFDAVQEYPITTSGWVPLTGDIASDAPSLDVYIRTTMFHRLRYRQSRQALYGGGYAPSRELNGILADDLHQTSTAASTEAAVVKALELVETAGGAAQADGLVLAPGAYWASVEANPDLWREIRSAGVRVVRTPAIAADTVLAGAWLVAGARRDGPIDVLVSNEHSDFFTKNKLALRCEQRMAVGYTAPDLFAEVTVEAEA